MNRQQKLDTHNMQNGLNNTETVPKYAPCRLFRKGDKVQVIKRDGRCNGEAGEYLREAFCTVTEDETQNELVRVLHNATEYRLDPAYLVLVSPVEEPEPYSASGSIDGCILYKYGVYYGEFATASQAEREKMKYPFEKSIQGYMNRLLHRNVDLYCVNAEACDLETVYLTRRKCLWLQQANMSVMPDAAPTFIEPDIYGRVDRSVVAVLRAIHARRDAELEQRRKEIVEKERELSNEIIETEKEVKKEIRRWYETLFQTIKERINDRRDKKPPLA